MGNLSPHTTSHRTSFSSLVKMPSYSFRSAAVIMAFVGSTILFLNISSRRADGLAAPVKPPYRGTPMGQGAMATSYSTPQHSMASQGNKHMTVQQPRSPTTGFSPQSPQSPQGAIIFTQAECLLHRQP